MDLSEDKRAIKFWSEDDRPREKLMLKGRHALSDSELLAILLGSGSRRQSALELARDILASYGGDINLLGRASIAELSRFPGIGQVKAVSIQAALELAQRRKIEGGRRQVIKSSQDAYDTLKARFTDLSHEEFWVLYLNQANKIILEKQISKGGLSGTVADPRIIFKTGLECGCSGLILAHNHPSSSLKPSQADLDLTRKLSLAARNLDMRVLDHLIFTQQGFVSFADEGWL
ncbi:MAG: DNA repair protein RadC [Bacteroidetes bacterium]|nr:DNA repair protein RadC [Bacteroidota bacterium]